MSIRYYNSETGEYKATHGFNNALNVNSFEFYLSVSSGIVPDARARTIFGKNNNFGTSAEDLWTPGGSIVQPTAGEQWEISAPDSNDRFGGTGAEVVQVEYLDVNFVRQVELVQLTGAVTPMVATDAYRHEITNVIQAGASRTNTGSITVRAAGGGPPRGEILATDGVSAGAIWTVPAGETCYVCGLAGAVPKGKDVTFSFRFTPALTGVELNLFDLNLYQISSSAPVQVPIALPEKSDVRVTCSSSNQNTNASAFYQTVYVRNN